MGHRNPGTFGILGVVDEERRNSDGVHYLTQVVELTQKYQLESRWGDRRVRAPGTRSN